MLPLLLALGGLLVVLGPRLAPRDESWHRAQDAVAQGQFQRAQSYLVDYVVRYPRDGDAHLLLARCYRQAIENDLESAELHLKQARQAGLSAAGLELEEDLLQYQYYGGPPDLEQRLAELAQSQPASAPLIWEALARGCVYHERLNAANKWLDRWVEAAPQDPRARIWRGALFEHLGRPELAIEDYRAAREQMPGDLLLDRRLGLALVVSGYDFEDASRLLTSYLAAQPDDADSLCGLARCQRAAGDLDAALATAEKVLAQAEDNIDALRTKALIELDRGQDEQALLTLQRLSSAGRQFEPRTAFQRLKLLDPVLDNPHQSQLAEEVLHLEAQALRRLGRQDEADQRVARLAELQDDIRQLKQLLGQRSERADDVEYLVEVVGLLIRTGQPRQADEWLQQLNVSAPNDPRLPALQNALRESAAP